MPAITSVQKTCLDNTQCENEKTKLFRHSFCVLLFTLSVAFSSGDVMKIAKIDSYVIEKVPFLNEAGPVDHYVWIMSA